MSKNIAFETNLTKCHIRALSFEKPFLLMGMGSTLYVFRTDKNGLKHLIFKKKVFKNLIISKIESLRSFQNDSNIEIIVSINGNRFLSVYKFCFNYNTNEYSLNELLVCHNFYDWILCVKIIGSLVFVVKAHNEIVIFDYNAKQMVDIISGTDKCILYSAEVMFVSEFPKNIVLCSGTVFKEIIIWTTYQTQEKSQMLSINLQRLRGHDGVIFALNYNKSLNLLVSASDDRSVRIWTSSLKTTDFCDSIQFWSENRFTESHIFYGHLSRIWSVRTITNPFPIILSVGEDSSLYLWDINEKKLIQRVDGHKNSSIWSLALDLESMLAFFGGSDSCLTSCDISNSITPFKCVVRQELYPKQIKLISLLSPNIFCSTISGDFLLMSTQTQMNSFTNSDYNKVFNTYSAIDINEDRNHILLGSKCGTIASIKVKDNGNPFEVQIKRIQNSKVFSICFIDFFNLIVCGIEGKIKMLSLKTFDQMGEYVLPNSKHRWPTAALLVKNLLIIGDRCGSVFLFSNESENPIKQFSHLHGINGVTAIKLRPKSQLMYSSGRNGKLFEYFLEDNNCSLLRVFRIFSDMEWIANFQFDEQTNEMSFIYGFQSRNFVVWDERQQRFVESIECGGGHRSWDFAILRNSFHFCYTKHENVISFEKNMSQIRNDSKLSLTQSSHSKKINCCSILFISQLMYFASGGEENVIHINSLNLETNDWRIESYLFGHISNISAICCASDHKSNCFMVSVGGRSQLMFWKIELKDKQLFCRQLFNKFLWPSDVIQNRCHKNNNFNSCSDPQIRYLDVNMSQFDEYKYLVSTACSDSSIRLFIFNSKHLTFEMVGNNSFSTSCVLRVLNIFDLHVMTASNDGTLKLWSISEEISENFDELESNQILMKQVLDLSPHECGVNAIDFFKLKENQWLIASGGDDNTLSLSVIEKNIKDVNQISSNEEKNIHCCQITGIKILSNNTIVSVAIDQRVVVWNYYFDSKTLKLNLEPMATYISSIADISSLCIEYVSHRNQWKAIICGEGFQSIDINIKNLTIHQ